MSRSPLSILYPAWHTCPWPNPTWAQRDQGAAPVVPIYRGLAWMLLDARYHGCEFAVLSAIRLDDVLARFNREHHTHLKGQAELIRLHRQNPHLFPPANPVEMTSHCLRSDGSLVYQHHGRHVLAGGHLDKFQLGIDVNDRGNPNGCPRLLRWLNGPGRYSVAAPYPAASEAHHIVCRTSPATRARQRLTAHYARSRR